MRFSDLISPVPPVPPGRLEANQTLEGAGGSITSVDFDPSVRGLGSGGMRCSLPPVSTPGRWRLWDLRKHMGVLELDTHTLLPGPRGSSACLGDLGCGKLRGSPALALWSEGCCL